MNIPLSFLKSKVKILCCALLLVALVFTARAGSHDPEDPRKIPLIIMDVDHRFFHPASDTGTLFWTEVTPFVYLESSCVTQRLVLLYTPLPSLLLSVGGDSLAAHKVELTHQMILRHGTIDTLPIYRLEFCLSPSVDTFRIWDGMWGGDPVALSHFASQHIGLYVDRDENPLMLRNKARYVQMAETQRSQTLQAVAEYWKTAGFDTARVATPREIADVAHSPATPPPASTPPPSADNRSEPSVALSPGKESAPLSSRPSQNWVFKDTDTSDIYLDCPPLEGDGAGYKVQILAKKGSEHDKNSVQAYYRLPYFVDMSYDGIWFRFTISGYGKDLEETRKLLQILQDEYGIEDAFITVHQGYRRLGILSFIPEA